MPTFNCIDETEIVIDGQAKYLYHFVNRGETYEVKSTGLKVTGYVDCHHVTEAIISAESFAEAQEILNEVLSFGQMRYHFDIYLTGVDLMPSREKKFLMLEYKSPI